MFRPWARSSSTAGDNPGREGRDVIFPLAHITRVFTGETMKDLITAQPEGIAVSLQVALTLAREKTRGLFDLPPQTIAMVVFSSIGDGMISPHHRDQLWKAFGLPLFEQMRGWDGGIIASECEVHNGLHLEPDAASSFVDHGMAAELLAEHCDCGKETPRLLSLSAIPAKAAAAAA